MESALQAVQNALPKLENRVIEFLAEWLVALLAPARHVLETRSPHLSFMLLKEYWFRELYLGLFFFVRRLRGFRQVVQHV